MLAIEARLERNPILPTLKILETERERSEDF
jgi:hypothetical protein